MKGSSEIFLPIFALSVIEVFTVVAFTPTGQPVIEIIAGFFSPGHLAKAICNTEPEEVFGTIPQKKGEISFLVKTSRNLTEKFLELNGTPDDAKEKVLKELAGVRKKYFVEAIRNNPSDALFQILNSKERETLLNLTENCVEVPFNVSGTLKVVHADFFDQNTSQDQMVLIGGNNKIYHVYPARGMKDNLISGTNVSLSGYLIDDSLLFDGLSPLNQTFIGGSGIDVVSPSDSLPALGYQQTAVIVANFQDTDTIFDSLKVSLDGALNQVNDYYKENSYGKTSFSFNIFGLYQLPMQKTCDGFNQVLAAAINAADPDIYFPSYQRLLIIAPFASIVSLCWAGVSTVGKIGVATSDGTSTCSFDSTKKCVWMSVSMVRTD